MVREWGNAGRVRRRKRRRNGKRGWVGAEEGIKRET